jgi:hypothetical protein
VTGAAVGNGLNEGLGDGLGDGSGLSLVDSAGLSEAFGLSLSLAGALAELPPLGVLVADTKPLAVGWNTDGGVELGVDVQADSATQASMVIRPQPTAVCLTRCAVHAMAVRAFIGPPHALGNDHFPVAGRRNRRRKGKRVAGPLAADRPAEELLRENADTITVNPGCGANTQWRAHHRNIRLLE